MNPFIIKISLYSLLGLFLFCFLLGGFYIVSPGERGVLVTLGKVNPNASPEGLGFKMPFVTSVIYTPVKQITEGLATSNFSSDLQTVNIQLKVLYRIPESSVVQIYQQYAGNPFDSLIAPRVQEALKEVAASLTAEQIVKQRELVKTKTLELARKKLGTILIISDLVIENVDLSDELERAIEQKMVQEQEAAKAKFIQTKATIEAQTAVIRAEGEAKAISVRGDALKNNPGVVDLMTVEKWNGVSPLVVGAGTNVLLPLSTK